MRKIVLASASPRRSELLKQIGIDFKVISSDVEENIDENMPAENIVESLSYQKALDIAKKINNDCLDSKDNPLVIGADTIVVKDGKILGKPKSISHAYEMLKALQGHWHEVITGVTIVDSNDSKFISDFEKTKVKMKKLDDDTIYRYIETKEPLDKAGSYGIQKIGALFIERIEGCYFNVVGLPLVKTSMILDKFGVKII